MSLSGRRQIHTRCCQNLANKMYNWFNFISFVKHEYDVQFVLLNQIQPWHKRIYSIRNIELFLSTPWKINRICSVLGRNDIYNMLYVLVNLQSTWVAIKAYIYLKYIYYINRDIYIMKFCHLFQKYVIYFTIIEGSSGQ